MLSVRRSGAASEGASAAQYSAWENFRVVIAATRYRSAIRIPLASAARPQQSPAAGDFATGAVRPGPVEQPAATTSAARGTHRIGVTSYFTFPFQASTAGSAGGHAGFISSSVFSIVSAISRSRIGLLSAGTTYQGAAGALQRASMSPYAAV